MGQFKSVLDREGIVLVERQGNGFLARRGDAEVVLSSHESSPKKPGFEDTGWWGVQQSFVERALASGLRWGIAFLHASEGGFWLDGRHFGEVLTGDLDSQGGHNFHLHQMEKAPELFQRFYSVREFLRVSRLEQVVIGLHITLVLAGRKSMWNLG